MERTDLRSDGLHQTGAALIGRLLQISSLQLGVDISARLHALVQHADDFDQAGRDHAIIENVHRPPYLRRRIIAAHMPNVKTADTAR